MTKLSRREVLKAAMLAAPLAGAIANPGVPESQAPAAGRPQSTRDPWIVENLEVIADEIDVTDIGGDWKQKEQAPARVSITICDPLGENRISMEAITVEVT